MNYDIKSMQFVINSINRELDMIIEHEIENLKAIDDVLSGKKNLLGSGGANPFYNTYPFGNPTSKIFPRFYAVCRSPENFQSTLAVVEAQCKKMISAIADEEEKYVLIDTDKWNPEEFDTDHRVKVQDYAANHNIKFKIRLIADSGTLTVCTIPPYKHIISSGNAAAKNLSSSKSIIEQLLSGTSNLLQKYDAQKKLGSDFNIFRIVGIETDEIAICSVIAELLSPCGSHNQGNLYLKIFVDKVLGLDANDDEWSNAEVIQEYSIADERRIDIVIITPKHFIAIEVKIYANEQRNQCADYYKAAENSGKVPLLYYLTIHGTMPSDYSKGTLNDDKINPISFEADIVKWLEECLGEIATQKAPPIREILLQLLTTIKKFTATMVDDELMEIKNLIMSSQENLLIAKKFSKALQMIHDDEIKIFAEKLHGIFKRIDDKISHQRIIDSNDYEGRTESFYRNYRTYLALTYHYKNVKDDIDMNVRMELSDYYGLAFGYTLTKSGQRGPRKNFTMITDEEIQNIIAPKPAKLAPSYWWSYLEGYKGNVDMPRFYKIDDPYTIEFFNDENKINAFIETCAGQINELLLK